MQMAIHRPSLKKRKNQARPPLPASPVELVPAPQQTRSLNCSENYGYPAEDYLFGAQPDSGL